MAGNYILSLLQLQLCACVAGVSSIHIVFVPKVTVAGTAFLMREFLTIAVKTRVNIFVHDFSFISVPQLFSCVRPAIFQVKERRTKSLNDKLIYTKYTYLLKS